MKLYYFETPNPRKACAVAKYLESPTEYVRVDLFNGEQKTEDFLEVNPNTKVPALTDGDTKLWESTAIMMYLSRKAGADLWPSDAAAQNEVVKWIVWDASHFSRHGATLLFENHIKKLAGLGEPDASAIEEATGFFKRFAGVLDDHLAGRTFLLGDQLTMADFAGASMLPTAKEGQLPVDDFREVARWHHGMMEMPAWHDPWPAAG